MCRITQSILLTHSLALSLGLGAGLLLCSGNGKAGAAPGNRIEEALARAPYPGHFRRDHPGSSRLYWADGQVGVGHGEIAFNGRMSVPASAGRSSTVYLTSDRITDREDFLRSQPRARRVGQITPQSRFLLEVPHDIDVDEFTTVVLWSHADQQLISSAQYRTAWDDEPIED